MKKLIFFSILMIFTITSCANIKLTSLEREYINELHQWVKTGNEDNINTIVRANCNKLTMLMANPKEKASFDDRSNLDEYNFRSDFCKSAVIENILPSQPGFTKAFKKKTCKKKVPFIKLICREFI